MIALRYEEYKYFGSGMYAVEYEDGSFENFIMSLPKECLYHVYIRDRDTKGNQRISLRYAHEDEVTLYAWVDLNGVLTEISAPIFYTGVEYNRRNPDYTHSARLERFADDLLQTRRTWINENTKSLNPGTAFNRSMTIDLFESHLGKAVSEILPAAQKMIEGINREKARNSHVYSEMMLENEVLIENVIGIDRKVERFNTGYRITVLMKTSKSYEEQLSFVKANKRLILKYAITEARTTQSGRRIEPKFYQVASMILSRHNELYITLELKESIIKALTEGGDK